MSTTPQPIGNMSLIGRTKEVLSTKLGFVMVTEMENIKKRHPRKDVSVKSDNRSKNYSKALQCRVIRVSETFIESRSSGDARSEQSEWSVCPSCCRRLLRCKSPLGCLLIACDRLRSRLGLR